MIRKGLILTLLFITTSCFNNKIKEIKDLSFEKLKVTKNVSQVNSNFLEGIIPKDLEDFLLKNNFITNKENITNDEPHEFIFKESEAIYSVIIDGNEKLKKIEFYSFSKTNSLDKAIIFFKQASKIPIPQVDTLRMKKWTESNMSLVNENLSRATILSNIHYIIEQINSNEFKLTIKKYSS